MEKRGRVKKKGGLSLPAIILIIFSVIAVILLFYVLFPKINVFFQNIFNTEKGNLSDSSNVITECIPNCTNIQCGLDPVCGQSCGECEMADNCINGVCVSENCIPNSNATACGSLRCGTKINNCGQQVNCGECEMADNCINGVCVSENCIPNSNATACGSLRCGNKTNNCGQEINCGTCSSGLSCDNGLCKNCKTRGTFCSSISSCCSGLYCVNSQCSDACATLGDGCASSYDCCIGSGNICSLGGKCISQNSPITILTEDYPRQFLDLTATDSENWFKNINLANILNNYYKNHTDSTDFLIVSVIEQDWDQSFNVHINQNIGGIGSVYEHAFSDITKNLSSLVLIPWYTYYLSNPTDLSCYRMPVLIHEIGHNWCCFLVFPPSLDYNANYGPHWPSNLELSYGNLTYIDLMQFYSWTINSSGQFCVQNGAVPKKFSNLSLYLMGLTSPQDVSPINLYQFQPIQGNDYYNTNGPECSGTFGNPTFTATKTVTINDITSMDGVRNPSYQTSQKNFNFTFVIIVPYGQILDSNFVNYVEQYKEELPSAWSTATKGLSTMTYSS